MARLTARGWMLLLGVAGFAVALYLTLTHYFQGTVPLACSSSGLVNCELVTSSAASMVGPLPVALLGLAWFVVLLALLGVEGRVAAPGLLLWELLWTAGGLGFVLYLVYAELFLIGSICAWCTAVHVLSVGLFLLALLRVTSPRPGLDDADDEAGMDDEPVFAATEERVPGAV